MDEIFEDHSYLSKTPFTNGPENLKMVKVDCKRKRGEKESDVPNFVLVLASSYLHT